MIIRIEPRPGAQGRPRAQDAAAPVTSGGTGANAARGNGLQDAPAAPASTNGNTSAAAAKPGSFAAAMNHAVSQADGNANGNPKSNANSPADHPTAAAKSDAPARQLAATEHSNSRANTTAVDSAQAAGTAAGPMATTKVATKSRPANGINPAVPSTASAADTASKAGAQTLAAPRDTAIASTTRTGYQANATSAGAKPLPGSNKTGSVAARTAADDPSVNLATAVVAGIAGAAALASPQVTAQNASVERRDTAPTVIETSGSARGYPRAAPMETGVNAMAARADAARSLDAQARGGASDSAAARVATQVAARVAGNPPAEAAVDRAAGPAARPNAISAAAAATATPQTATPSTSAALTAQGGSTSPDFATSLAPGAQPRALAGTTPGAMPGVIPGMTSGGASAALPPSAREALASEVPGNAAARPGAGAVAGPDTAAAADGKTAPADKFSAIAMDAASAGAAASAASEGFAAMSAAALRSAGPAPAGTQFASTGPAGTTDMSGINGGIDSALATALNQLNAPGTSAPGNTTGLLQAPIATHVGDAEFGAAVSRQLVSLARTGVQSAELVLNPAHLGPVSVSIQMSGQQATLSMTAEHEATRTALRAALPQLDALFTQSGLQLGSAHVGGGSEGNSGRQDAPDSRNAAPFAAPGGAPAEVSSAATAPRASGVTRLVDTFA